MAFIGLVSDSTAFLPDEIIARYGIRVAPLYIKWGEQTYRDGVDLTAAEFYQRLPHNSILPTTSQPSVGDFEKVYRELVDQGASGIISAHLSAGISGTVNSANLAAQQVGSVPIEVVDTRCAGAMHMLAVEAGARAIAAGANLKESVEAINRVVEAHRTVFTVDTLEYLYKGGRIGGAAALLGSMLQFKPLLHFRDGKIDALERVRKSSRALQRMVEVMASWVGNTEPMQCVIMHADCMDRVEAAVELLKQQINVADVRVTLLTPVIGAHVGPGTLGLCCCPISALNLA